MEAITITNTRNCCCFFSSPSPNNNNIKPTMAMRRAPHPPPPSAVAAAVKEPLPQTTDTCRSSPPGHSQSQSHSKSRIDRSGKFCSPRSARELALMISYASCLQGSDPVQLFDSRINAKRVPGYVFDKQLLLSYDHMTFATEPIQVASHEEEQQLIDQFETDSAFEADVLSAPLKLVYSNFVLRFTREILEAVASGWNQRVHVINKVIPQSWKNEAASRIIELCILHIAMAEITSKGTKHQIVINEAVDLAKRFCDGRAPRIINGCLRTFVKQRSEPFRAEEILESEAIRLT
ncbi:hypothetical protein LUZ61_016542 [Rhynchospora tenuis]|uniref:NusB/RsmB/TIM44 domain-containing protein n=1 Tax=Rhynchospora tenuis TaxID=198213 RepID=A0AAD6EK73_9POAL|nr:hypothetical protein LUZ61_016542 [Rhynchospora tenuis]